jgi:hypothetical protein
MPSESRSLWEQLDSEVEPWRRGRFVIALIATFSLLLQTSVFVANIMDGNIEAVLAFGSVCAVFWLQFYFIWIGVQWIRWVVGAWAGLGGFCSLIWGWRDGNGLLILVGVINLLIGSYFCLSSSVYFFAKRQQERRSWLHSLVIAGVFVLLFLTFVIGTIGLFGYRARTYADAIQFVDEAAEHIYTDQDREWMFAHLSPVDLAAGTQESLNAFFAQNVGRLGPVLQISTPTGPLRLIYHFPVQFTSKAQLAAEGKSGYGPVRIYFWISDTGEGWKIDRTWWERTYTESPPSYR